MPILLYICMLFFLVLQACNFKDPSPTSTGVANAIPVSTDEALPRVVDSEALRRVPDDKTAEAMMTTCGGQAEWTISPGFGTASFTEI